MSAMLVQLAEIVKLLLEKNVMTVITTIMTGKLSFSFILHSCTGCEIDDGYICPTEGGYCYKTSDCGDGKLDSGEICDDGNNVSLDGCQEDCALIEDGWTCFGGDRYTEPMTCLPIPSTCTSDAGTAG